MAPWLSGNLLQDLIDRSVSQNGYWTSRTLGDLFEVTLVEKLDPGLDLRNVECFDADRWKYKERLKERQRVRDANRKRIKRAKQNATSTRVPNDQTREGFVSSILTKRWTPVSTICTCVRKKDWRKPSGKTLKPASIQRAVNRVLDNLEARSMVETKLEKGDRGLLVRFARRV
jgi:hypothetical protein